MRELYACQLDLACGDDPARVRQLVVDWVARGSGADVAQLLDPAADRLTTASGHVLDVEVVEPDDDAADAADGGPVAWGPGAADVATASSAAGWTCSWRRTDDSDPTLQWRVLLAVGPPGAGGPGGLAADSTVGAPGAPSAGCGVVRVSVRIAVERAQQAFLLAPPRFVFRSPTVVRTLLRAYPVRDAGVVVSAEARRRQARDVPALAELLLDQRRTLPVVVLSDNSRSGVLAASRDLAHELAGLAHVEVLTTHLAAMALSKAIGRDLAVWGGGLRVFWPRLQRDDPQPHRLWRTGALGDRDGVIGQLRGVLGAASASAVPEHPVVTAARARRRRLVEETALAPWMLDFVADTDEELGAKDREIKDLRQALAAAQAAEADLREELADVRREFAVVQGVARADGTDGVDGAPVGAAPDADLSSVQAAFALARDEAHPGVVYLPGAEAGAQRFATYGSPLRLYEALSAVDEAAEAWREGTLGAGFGAYFAERGYEFSARNPAARARPTRDQYTRAYGHRKVTMEAHLKVDQSTSPDQCLRVYWYVDDVHKKLVVGHVGRHLAD